MGRYGNGVSSTAGSAWAWEAFSSANAYGLLAKNIEV
jgi:hypothetical protein